MQASKITSETQQGNSISITGTIISDTGEATDATITTTIYSPTLPLTTLDGLFKPGLESIVNDVWPNNSEAE